MGLRDPRPCWFLTYPQNDATKEFLLEKLMVIDTIKEYVIASELHEDGHQHLHAYVKFETGVIPREAPNKFHVLAKTGNYQVARSCKAVIDYCSKEENYITNINIKSYLEKRGKLLISTIRSKTTREALIDGDISISGIRNYSLARGLLLEPYEHPYERGIWIYGKPRTGKSRSVVLKFPDRFNKQANKWFDGYDGQDVILLDDFECPFLAGHLKQWTDWKACPAEIKGATTELQHKLFLVTSNKLPRQIFLKSDGFPDLTLCEAIESRFKFIHKTSIDQDISDQLCRLDRYPNEGGMKDPEHCWLAGWHYNEPNITN